MVAFPLGSALRIPCKTLGRLQGFPYSLNHIPHKMAGREQSHACATFAPGLRPIFHRVFPPDFDRLQVQIKPI